MHAQSTRVESVMVAPQPLEAGWFSHGCGHGISRVGIFEALAARAQNQTKTRAN